MNFYEIAYEHAKDPNTYESNKWEQYFHIYNKVLAPYVLEKKPLNLLEIGVATGGSLQLWNKFLPVGSQITGIDINEKCKEINYKDSENIKVIIADASADVFIENNIKNDMFDIIIDDGSHICEDVIKTFEMLFEKVNFGGLYIIEDVHTSYWKEGYKGGYKYENSTMEYFKMLTDSLNYDYIDKSDKQLKSFGCLENETAKRLKKYNKEIASITFYDSVIIIEKYIKIKDRPFYAFSTDKKYLAGPVKIHDKLTVHGVSSNLQDKGFFREQK